VNKEIESVRQEEVTHVRQEVLNESVKWRSDVGEKFTRIHSDV
jgi:hypothetical protein